MIIAISFFIVFLQLQVAGATADMQAQLVDGSVISGSLVDWSDRQITVATRDGEQRIDIDQFARLVNQRLLSSHKPLSAEDQQPACEITVGLKGGTRLCGWSISGTSDALTLKRAKEFTITLPTAELKYVRFRRPTDELRQQWQELLEGEFKGDVLVIRRSSSSLDFLEGVIRGLSEQQVVFEFEGERIEVKREKLEGCLFFSGRQPRHPPASMTVRTSEGDRIAARQINLQNRTWHLQTVEGVQLTVPTDHVQSVTFASRRVTFLSDMQPVATNVVAAIGSLAGANEYLMLIYGPRQDRGYDGPLQLRFAADNQVRTFTKGLALHSRTELTYRLDGGPARLMGLLGLAPDNGTGGSARLAITVDGHVVFDQIIQRQAEPVKLDVDISGGRRLEILADYGDDGDLGDRLYLCELRIIK